MSTSSATSDPPTTHNDTLNNTPQDSSDAGMEDYVDRHGADEELKPRDNDQKILSAYRGLESRRVDLVGDYAGNELFLIEGDSMLLRCFGDDKLDFANGFQLLHAVYNVELFLSNLTQRKCNFKIVFFDCNEQLCIPKTASKDQTSKYLLARSIVIRHLSTALVMSHPGITLDVFPSWRSSKFIHFLQTTSAYFVMAHDGAQSISRRNGDDAEDKGDMSGGAQHVALRRMILSLIEAGTNVALVNELQWQDTKVMAVVLENRHRSPKTNALSSDVSSSETITAKSVIDEVHRLKDSGFKMQERQILAVITISIALKNPSSMISAMEWTELCRDFLLHQALLEHVPLSMRRTREIASTQSEQKFMSAVASISASILNHKSWHIEHHTAEVNGGIADYLDGRLFLLVRQNRSQVCKEAQETVAKLQGGVNTLIGAGMLDEAKSQPRPANIALGQEELNTRDEDSNQMKVLPFSNHVFDHHLKSVRLEVDAATYNKQSLTSRKVFKEVTHWHNAKRPLVHKGAPVPVDARQAKKAATRNQRFMAEMQKYAASLTNAIGRSLEPETIIAGQPKFSVPASENSTPTTDSKVVKSKPPAKKGGGAKTDAKNATKNAMLAKQATEQTKRAAVIEDKLFSAWEVVRKDIAGHMDPRVRYRRTQAYLGNLPSSSRDVVGTNCELYMINCLVSIWNQVYHPKDNTKNLYIAALVWSHLHNILQYGRLTKSSITYVTSVIDIMNLPLKSENHEAIVDRKLVFSLDLPTKTRLPVTLPNVDFQLLHCGPYLERSFDSRPDSRVDFKPDGWQRSVLDSIDADRSVFVVAPTSAGKTFISFYAMRKILEADDDGVLVYVAPTKALVNQIAAEIQGRYSKSFKHGGKSVWAIHTRDYRINNPNGCQILVTVPHVLQIMLLAPSNAKSWSSRIRRIIFDEIHSIGQAEDGVVWEQLLLMAPSPIIALSATVGNPGEFAQWLASTQNSIGYELDTIEHPYRYSDLRKYYYVPPEKFSFAGLSDRAPLNDLSLDGLPGLRYFHPVAALVDRSRGIPDDLALEPRDCLLLCQAMKKFANEEHPLIDELNHVTALPDEPRKQDILKWEKVLKKQLQKWLEDPASPFDRLLRELEQDFRDEVREEEYSSIIGVGTDTELKPIEIDDLINTTLPLLCRLNERDALPAIFFNYDRHHCERIGRALLDELAASEAMQVKSGPKWQKTIENWQTWKDLRAKAASKSNKSAQKKPSKKTKDGVDDADKMTKLDVQRESASAADDRWERFDPEIPQDGYHFADHTKLQASELAEYVKELRYRDIASWLIEALGRGIGIHHAGMNRKYRQVVEILFRKRFLRVIIATGTLALGINMPCKTVVFSGDSVYLTALNYRQCAGRAGRRGFDLLGNVVFQGIPRQKVCRLISSRLPSLTGHFPITTSFVLRLFTLLHESDDSKYAVTAVNSVLSQPRLYMGGASFKDQTMHHVRFSIEYLRRQHLLGDDGAPLNLAGLVSHLYYTENSSFAFHALLKEGYFNNLCNDIQNNEKNVLETLMLVMSHLFGRTFHRQSDIESIRETVKTSSSMILLPLLPQAASTILREHNRETLSIYKTYVQTFVDQHISHRDNVLPLTGTAYGGNDVSMLESGLEETKIRSSFVALSGAGDSFESIHDLCTTVRSGVFLEEAVIPYMQIYPDDTGVPLNAWLLDFFRHGDVATLERDNGIRRSDVWFHLNDFSLVLATIVTSLLNFMKLGPGGDVDMLDLQGGMDVVEEAKDEQADGLMEGSDKKTEVAKAAVKVDAAKQIKRKTLDSWEDANEELEMDQDHAQAAHEEEKMTEELSAWNLEEDGGLRNVLKAFQKLQVEFNEKFRAMWA